MLGAFTSRPRVDDSYAATVRGLVELIFLQQSARAPRS